MSMAQGQIGSVVYPGDVKGEMADTFASVPGQNPVCSGPFIPNDFLGGAQPNPYGDQNPYVPQYDKPDITKR